jgi:hypothetical protein
MRKKYKVRSSVTVDLYAIVEGSSKGEAYAQADKKIRTDLLLPMKKVAVNKGYVQVDPSVFTFKSDIEII